MTAVPFNTSYSTNSLEYLVAQAGGTPVQLNLFNYLLSASGSYVQKDNPKNKGILFDYRAATSLLFLFPIQVQAALSIYFYLQEKRIHQNFESVFTITSNIQEPATILTLNQSITQIPISLTLMSFLSLKDYENNEAFKVLLGFSEPEKAKEVLFSTDPIIQTLPKFFNLIPYADQRFPFLEKYKEVAASNNRLEAIVLIAESFNYSFPYIQSIANLCELWLLQNSSF